MGFCGNDISIRFTLAARMARRHAHVRRWRMLVFALVAALATPLSAQDVQTGAQDRPISSPPLVGDDLMQNDIGVEWPDLSAPLPDATTPADPAPTPTGDAADAAGATGATGNAAEPQDGVADPQAAPPAEVMPSFDPAEGLRYQTRVSGIEEIADPLFMSRFDDLSALRTQDDDRANIAQLRRRIRTDQELLEQLMRTRGYYDSRSSFSVMPDPDNGDDAVIVTLTVEPGTQYLLRTVAISGIDETDPRENAIRSRFVVEPGDPIDTDRIVASEAALREGLAEGGYPFARVEAPQVRVDHEAEQGDLSVAVTTGGYHTIGAIVVEGDRPPFDARHVDVIARFDPGSPYAQSTIDDLRRAIISTSLVSTVDIKPQQSATPGIVDIHVDMVPAPYRTIAGEIGYGTGEGFRAEASWQHRNLFPPEGAVTVRGVAGTQEQSIAALFRRSNFGGRDRALNAALAVSSLDRPAFDARTIDLNASYERQTNIVFQKKWTWSLGAQLVLTDERGFLGRSLIEQRRTFYIAALPLALAYDGSDDLLDPETGFRLSGRLSPELSLQSGTFGYARVQIDASAYQPLGDNVVLAGRVRLGTLAGASRDRVAPSRRFYAGGGSSVRGFGYQDIGPQDINGNPIGGRSLAEAAVEARFRFGSARQFGIVPFIDAGNVSTGYLPRIRDFRIGVGVGARYYSSFGPIRIDIGTPINRRAGEPVVAVAVSLGQAF